MVEEIVFWVNSQLIFKGSEKIITAALIFVYCIAIIGRPYSIVLLHHITYFIHTDHSSA